MQNLFSLLNFFDTNPIVLQAAVYINMFFIFSFCGWVMECCVLTVEKRRLVYDRGFIHGPFCIIYGFGAILGYYVLRLFDFGIVPLFVCGAVSATLFELFTAVLMKRLFGSFWWDYSQKPFNYKGMICLESTLGWGFIAVLIVRVLFKAVWRLSSGIPGFIAVKCAALLVIYYSVDFIISMRHALLIKACREDNRELNPREI